MQPMIALGAACAQVCCVCKREPRPLPTALGLCRSASPRPVCPRLLPSGLRLSPPASTDHCPTPPLPAAVPTAGYLPLVWAGTLAYYLDNAFEEAGLILPVSKTASFVLQHLLT